jgi:hypothetical protein
MRVGSTLETVQAICQIKVCDAYKHLGELQNCVEEALRVRSHGVMKRFNNSQDTIEGNVFAVTRAAEQGSHPSMLYKAWVLARHTPRLKFRV